MPAPRNAASLRVQPDATIRPRLRKRYELPNYSDRIMNAKILLSLTIAVVVLAAGYALLKPHRGAENPQAGVATLPPVDAQATPRQAAALAAPAANQVLVQDATPNVYDIVVRGGRRISEPAVLKVHQGDDVKFRITSDVADEFHLHGYNLHVQVSAEQSAVLQFTAKLTGRFTYELHKSGKELGALEVYPR
jgi:heme/copper-type cytochrome/quinol oxidase subunit 2